MPSMKVLQNITHRPKILLRVRLCHYKGELSDSSPAERDKPRDLQCLLQAWLIGLWVWKNGLTPQ
jgi:hypothetical protein